MGIHEKPSFQDVRRTVDDNGNALKELHAILAAEGWDLAELADLKVLGGPGLFENLEVEIIRLCDRLDSDGTRLVALKKRSQTSACDMRSKALKYKNCYLYY